jgi:hypothetical protein
MNLSRVIVALGLVMVAVLLAVGCAGQTPASENLTLVTHTEQIGKLSDPPEIIQPGSSPTIMIKTNSDAVRQGDRVEFYLTNATALGTLCPNYIPSYGVTILQWDGSWTYLDEPREMLSPSDLVAPSSSPPIMHEFSTEKMGPGYKFRIQIDCGGISRNFTIINNRSPVCDNSTVKPGTKPWVGIEPVPDQYTGELFELWGYTILPPGTPLSFSIAERGNRTCPPGGCRYTSVFGNATVMSGPCGLNTWSSTINLSGMIPTCDSRNCSPEYYDIWVMTINRTAYTRFPVKIREGIRPKNPYLSYPVVRYDDFSFTGTAPHPLPDQTSPAGLLFGGAQDPGISKVQVWLFGKTYASMTVYPVKPDRSFNVTLNRSETESLQPGTYFMVIQYPRMRNMFDIRMMNGSPTVIDRNGTRFLNYSDVADSRITGFEAMQTLEEELKNPASRDRYSVISLDVTTPMGARLN